MSQHFDWRENQNVPGVAINPGTGPVRGATLEHAEQAIGKLLEDAGLDPTVVERHFDGTGSDGRHSFTLRLDGRACEVDMPGIPLEAVRYTGAPEQDIFDFPRLYVNGSSWVWTYAVGFVRRGLTGEDDDA